MKNSKMTVGGVSTCPAGTEQHEYYTTILHGRRHRLCQYDYRHTNGKLFSTVRPMSRPEIGLHKNPKNE